jgi:hypothetical protein
MAEIGKPLKGPDEENTVVTFEESSNKMKAKDLEESSEVTEPVAEQQELRIEVVKVEDFGSLKDQPLDQQVVLQRRRWKLQDQKKLTARKRIIRHAVHAVRKGHLRKRPGKSSFTRGIPNGRTLEITKQTCHNEIWNHTSKDELSQCNVRTSDMSIRKKELTRPEYKSGIKGRGAT